MQKSFACKQVFDRQNGHAYSLLRFWHPLHIVPLLVTLEMDFKATPSSRVLPKRKSTSHRPRELSILEPEKSRHDLTIQGFEPGKGRTTRKAVLEISEKALQIDNLKGKFTITCCIRVKFIEDHATVSVLFSLGKGKGKPSS